MLIERFQRIFQPFQSSFVEQPLKFLGFRVEKIQVSVARIMLCVKKVIRRVLKNVLNIQPFDKTSNVKLWGARHDFILSKQNKDHFQGLFKRFTTVRVS